MKNVPMVLLFQTNEKKWKQILFQFCESLIFYQSTSVKLPVPQCSNKLGINPIIPINARLNRTFAPPFALHIEVCFLNR